MRQVALAIVALFSLVSFAAGGTIDGKIVGRIDKPFSPQHPAVVWLEGITTQPASDGAPPELRLGLAASRDSARGPT